MSPSQPLPQKENALFKKILRCYEHKQYKNGLKFAKQILTNPKHCEHGETLAMKGLTLNCLGRKDEAYDYVRRGLRNDLTSHVCWHVYGLLQRSDHKYDEAIKCYRNALKWDKENIQILRDLSLLQVQMRDLDGYRDTRYQLFRLRPTQRASWIGFAMAYHLLRDYPVAVRILEEFRKTTSSSNQNKNMHGMNNKAADYEHSELLLYQVMVYIEGGYYQEALDHLGKYAESEICDKLAVHEYKAELLILMKRNKDASKLIREQLIGRNPENRSYYFRLEEALEKKDDENFKLKIYQNYQKIYNKSQVPFRLPLNFITEPDTFKESVDFYLKRSLRKGQPALFRDLKSLYANEMDGKSLERALKCDISFKIQIIENLMHKYHTNLIQHGSFESEESSWGSEDATCILWVDYYLSQHHDYLGRFSKALNFANEAINHTPTLIELYVIKGKIFKHAGNIEQAVLQITEAQGLDTADRYLNSKCAKYLLRANRVQDAEEMCSKFTREGVSACDNLNEMQCMWFQSEAALAYQRLDKWGDSLKKCIEIDRHFAEITEDQFDFHTYCMRKMTLRSYVNLLRLENVLKSHRFFFIAAKIAIEVYLRLYDKPLGLNDVSENISPSDITPQELKKMISKKRKAEKKARAVASTTDQSQNSNTNDKNAENASTGNEVNNEKLIPHKLERPEEPLVEAIKFLKPLQLFVASKIDTHLLAFEIYCRKGKLMLMLQSLKRAVKINKNHSTLLRQIVLFYNLVKDKKDGLGPALQEVLEREMTNLLGMNFTGTPLELNEVFLQRNMQSLIHRLESSKMIVSLNNEDEEVRKNAVNILSSNLENLDIITIDSCVETVDSLRQGKIGTVDETIIEGIRKRCSDIFPLATNLMSSFELKQQQQHCVKSLVNHCDKNNINHKPIEGYELSVEGGEE